LVDPLPMSLPIPKIGGLRAVLAGVLLCSGSVGTVAESTSTVPVGLSGSLPAVQRVDVPAGRRVVATAGAPYRRVTLARLNGIVLRDGDARLVSWTWRTRSTQNFAVMQATQVVCTDGSRSARSPAAGRNHTRKGPRGTLISEISGSWVPPASTAGQRWSCALEAWTASTRAHPRAGVTALLSVPGSGLSVTRLPGVVREWKPTGDIMVRAGTVRRTVITGLADLDAPAPEGKQRRLWSRAEVQITNEWSGPGGRPGRPARAGVRLIVTPTNGRGERCAASTVVNRDVLIPSAVHHERVRVETRVALSAACRAVRATVDVSTYRTVAGGPANPTRVHGGSQSRLVTALR
jgi:hypothetical protein